MEADELRSEGKRMRHMWYEAMKAWNAPFLAFVAVLALAGAASAGESDYRPLDLRPVVNMGWRDEAGGDGKGGWTDQGRNDMRYVNLDQETFAGIPFDLIDPEKNGGKAILVLKSENSPFGAATASVPLGESAGSIYFLHCAAWSSGHMATYVVHYADGSEAAIPVRDGKELENWWSPEHSDRYRVGFYARNERTSSVGMLVYAWDNPHPGKTIESLEFRSENTAGVVILAGVTLSSKGAALPPKWECARPRSPETISRQYGVLLKSQGPAKAAQELLEGYVTERADLELSGLAKNVSDSPDTAIAVLDELAKERSALRDGLRAELLWHYARRMKLEGELARRAAALLDHEDPFVRGLAEWAISVRINRDNLGRTYEWPSEDGPDWYEKWRSLSEEDLLAVDYIRQGVDRDVHRSTKALVKSARATVERANGLAAYVRKSGTDRRVAQLESRIEGMQAALDEMTRYAESDPDDLTGQRSRWLKLRLAAREVVLSNPDLDFDEVLFATRSDVGNNGNITRGFYMQFWQPRSELYRKSGFHPADGTQALLKGRLGPGHMRGMDLWWDAGRLVFSWCKQPDYYKGDQPGKSRPAHLYEVNVDGSGLRQITDHPCNSDTEPTYLPDGAVAFVSDRSNYGSQCAGSFWQDRKIMNLYRASADGRDIRPLTNNKDFDRYPHSMDNGQILFLHWEYQERHLWQPHTLWTCRPDGTQQDSVYKQHIRNGPMSLRDTRQVWGSDMLVGVACGHHNWAMGALMMINHQKGINDPSGMYLLTPNISGTEGGLGGRPPVPEGGVPDGGGYYVQPWPLSEKSVLAGYSYDYPRGGGGENYAIYYVDVWGNKEMIHRERYISCVYPVALRERKAPPVLPDATDQSKNYATTYVTDVYRDLPGVEKGEARYIRISQHMPWPAVQLSDEYGDFNDLHWSASGTWARNLGIWSWSPARVIGTVPVEEDGSAHFKVPVEQPVYFQLLDENYMELRRMRSFVTYQPGENRGCWGCHESRNIPPPRVEDTMPRAVSRPADMPEPPVWGHYQVLDYEGDVQPILNRHCVRCHGVDEPAGGLEFTDRRVGNHFQSYRTMFGITGEESERGRYVNDWTKGGGGISAECNTALRNMEKNAHPGQLVSIANRMGGSHEVTQPKQFGSHKSKLITHLLNDAGHRRNVHLSETEWRKLVCWVDLNAPYFSSYMDHHTDPPRWVDVIFSNPWEDWPGGDWNVPALSTTRIAAAEAEAD